jgi:hypothetical protein
MRQQDAGGEGANDKHRRRAAAASGVGREAGKTAVAHPVSNSECVLKSLHPRPEPIQIPWEITVAAPQHQAGCGFAPLMLPQTPHRL